MAKVTINAERCKGCELCVNACPKGVLAISQDTINSKGYHPAQAAAPENCTGCTSCALTCPDVAITVER